MGWPPFGIRPAGGPLRALWRAAARPGAPVGPAPRDGAAQTSEPPGNSTFAPSFSSLSMKFS